MELTAFLLALPQPFAPGFTTLTSRDFALK